MSAYGRAFILSFITMLIISSFSVNALSFKEKNGIEQINKQRQKKKVAIQDTPAGRRLREFLEVISSGDERLSVGKPGLFLRRGMIGVSLQAFYPEIIKGDSAGHGHNSCRGFKGTVKIVEDHEDKAARQEKHGDSRISPHLDS